MAAKEKKGLGTGLGVLFGADEFDDEAEQLTLPISKVEPRSEQPREYFDQEALEALMRDVLDPLPGVVSIRTNVILSRVKDVKGLRL